MKRRNFLFTLLGTLVDPVEAFGAAADDIKAQRSLAFGRDDDDRSEAGRRRVILDMVKARRGQVPA
jgi:hypothetical protein